MKRLVVAFAVVAAGLAGMPQGSAASPAIVIKVTRSGWADVAFGSAFGVDLAAATLKTAGRYGGFYAERAGQPFAATSDHFGLLRAQTTPDNAATASVEKDAAPPYQEPVTYAAGRYRFYVVAERPAEIRVPLTGVAAGVTVKPSKPLKAAYATADATPAGTVYEARVPFAVQGRTAVLALGKVKWTGAGSHLDVSCFAKPGGACDAVVQPALTGQAGPNPGAEQSGTGGVFAGPGILAAGEWEGVFRTATAPAFDKVTGFVVAFETP